MFTILFLFPVATLLLLCYYACLVARYVVSDIQHFLGLYPLPLNVTCAHIHSIDVSSGAITTVDITKQLHRRQARWFNNSLSVHDLWCLNSNHDLRYISLMCRNTDSGKYSKIYYDVNSPDVLTLDLPTHPQESALNQLRLQVTLVIHVTHADSTNGIYQYDVTQPLKIVTSSDSLLHITDPFVCYIELYDLIQSVTKFPNTTLSKIELQFCFFDTCSTLDLTNLAHVER